MKRNKQHIATSLKRPASPPIQVDDDESLDSACDPHHGQVNMLLKPPFLTPSAIVRTDRSSSFINLTEAYRGNPYDIRNLSPLRRRSEPPNSQVIPQPPSLEGLQCQAAGHPEYEMDYEEQPLDMSIKGKSVNYSSNGSSSSTSPSIDILVTSPTGSQSATTVHSQVNRPSVITCAPSLKMKNENNSPVDLSSESDCSHSMLANRIVSSPGSSINYTNSISPKSNGHSQDTMIANETAKLNISKSVTLEENPVDEHFRRSLGGLFSSGLFKSSSSSANRASSSSPNANSNSQMLKNTCMSSDSPVDDAPVKSSVTSIITEVCTDVDDHFAKALGADWLKLRKNEPPEQAGASGSGSN